jgi:hypothetical protein
MNMKHLKMLASIAAVVLLAAGLSGCATTYSTTSKGPTSFLAYDGKQQRWPRGESALVKSSFTVPAYQGLPPNAYTIQGVVATSDSPVAGAPSWMWGDETRLANACNQAKEHGADAVMVTTDPTVRKAVDSIPTTAGVSKQLLASSDALVVAIKWVR